MYDKTHFFKKERTMESGEPIPEKIRRKIYERSKGRCEYCGKKAVDIHHIVYRSRGGDNSEQNLIALCRKCHDNSEILETIAKNPKKYFNIYPW